MFIASNCRGNERQGKKLILRSPSCHWSYASAWKAVRKAAPTVWGSNRSRSIRMCYFLSFFWIFCWIQASSWRQDGNLPERPEEFCWGTFGWSRRWRHLEVYSDMAKVFSVRCGSIHQTCFIWKDVSFLISAHSKFFETFWFAWSNPSFYRRDPQQAIQNTAISLGVEDRLSSADCGAAFLRRALCYVRMGPNQ